MPNTKKLRLNLENLRLNLIPEDELYLVIGEFGRQGFLEAKTEIERCLGHRNCVVRYAALTVLVLDWRRAEHRKTCENFLLYDDDGDNRRLGAAGLGSLLEGSKEAKALQLLLRYFCDEDQRPDIRKTAYSEILSILGTPVSQLPSAVRDFDFSKDVNWARIQEAEEIVKKQGVSENSER